MYLSIKIIYSIYANKITNNKNKSLSDLILKNKFINSILKILPGPIVYIFSGIFTVNDISWTMQMSQLIESLSLLYILVFSMRSIFISLELIKEWLQKREHAQYSLIKSFMQVLKIIIVFIVIVIAISIIMNKSPLILLTGLGALSAVLLLVFKDSLIGLVANIQVSAYDTVRIGDWVTIPSHGADGTIMDININIVTIQNFDKTVISVPTGALITNSVTNWRAMFESGGRRIKRSIKIDINTIVRRHYYCST
jgi:miniconductance mechanosensitive channel